ncbi:30S ribosome-binding factor RbfA [Yaniella flava]|uniref:Ribosome-binding factor A n=1 Tax=Yaniella flava TaxID=287930 RepID=A0ABN2UGK6_9MICC
MADHNRAARLAQRIKVILAEALQKTVKDDRVENVTITEARVTNDLQQASVYYTVYGDEETVAVAHQAMEENRGLMRREMGRGLNIRLVPTLELIPDTVPENAAQLEEVLRAAKARDAELAAQRESATYAGDEDPYKE